MYESMKVVEAVRAIVAENPDAVYPENRCLYTEGKAGSGRGCLVGQAIVRVYPELKEKLEDIDLRINPMANTLIQQHLNFTESKAGYWLNLVQINQDSGEQWDFCVKRADEVRPLS